MTQASNIKEITLIKRVIVYVGKPIGDGNLHDSVSIEARAVVWRTYGRWSSDSCENEYRDGSHVVDCIIRDELKKLGKDVADVKVSELSIYGVQPMMIELAKGESIRVTLKDSDGSFTLKYGKHVLSISTEWADSEDRKGVIYQLNFTQDAKLAQLAEDEEMDIKFMDGGSDPKADSDLQVGELKWLTP